MTPDDLTPDGFDAVMRAQGGPVVLRTASQVSDGNMLRGHGLAAMQYGETVILSLTSEGRKWVRRWELNAERELYEQYADMGFG